MPSYRCYFIDRNDRFGEPPEIIEADARFEAIGTALAMLRARPHYQAIEVWEGARRVYPLPPPRGPSLREPRP